MHDFGSDHLLSNEQLRDSSLRETNLTNYSLFLSIPELHVLDASMSNDIAIIWG